MLFIRKTKKRETISDPRKRVALSETHHVNRDNHPGFLGAPSNAPTPVEVRARPLAHHICRNWRGDARLYNERPCNNSTCLCCANCRPIPPNPLEPWHPSLSSLPGITLASPRALFSDRRISFTRKDARGGAGCQGFITRTPPPCNTIKICLYLVTSQIIKGI